MAQAGYAAKVEGSLVFLLTSILDGCDGEIARAKQMMSKLGGWLDLWGDNVVHVAVFYGLGIGLFKDTGNPVYRDAGHGPRFLERSSRRFWPAIKRGEKAKAASRRWPGIRTRGGHAPGLAKTAIALSDALARRDFVYGVVVLALIQRLNGFLGLRDRIDRLCLRLGVLCLFTRPSASPL